MRPLNKALESLERAILDPYYRAGRRKVAVDSEDLNQLLLEFRKLDAQVRLNHNKGWVENHQPLSHCFQCPNFHSFHQNGKDYGSCSVLGVVKEISKDKSVKSIFDDLWCVFHGVQNHGSLYAVKSSKPEFTPPAQFVGKKFDW